MNKVIITGRLTRDPESRMTQGNMEVARFSLAAQNDFTNKNGERDVEFIKFSHLLTPPYGLFGF